MTKDTEALRDALIGVRAWVASLTVTDMNEIVADGGITAGMVVGQEAGEQLRRLDAALATPASDVAPDEYDTLIAAGFNDYAAHCALRTEPDGGFCHAYFYSDGQWRFQTGGNDLTLADGTILRCVLTKRLYAHPPLAQSVDPVAGEAVDFPDMRRPVIGIERCTAQEVFDIMADRIRLAEAGHYRLAALQGPAA